MRIIAGAWRGRALRAPPGAGTRPTADRVRQALFDALLHAPWSPWSGTLDGARVLDAFAGTGALGLEALSRGAAHAVFLERDRAAFAVLRGNVASCGAGERADVRQADALRPPPGGPCGLVFLDPPYGKGLPEAALRALGAAGWLAANAVVVVETGAEEALPGAVLHDRTHGAARLRVLRLEAGLAGGSLASGSLASGGLAGAGLVSSGRTSAPGPPATA